MDMFTSISSKTLPFESHDSLGVYRDASFSSYLNGKDDNFIRKITESTRYQLNPSIISTTATPVELLAGKNGAEDGEIGVFGAERYFNGGMDGEGSSQRSATSSGTRKPATESSKKVDKVVPCHHIDDPMKPKPWLGTPSVGSESSSINSQTALLQSFLRNTTTATTMADNNYISSNYSRPKKTINGKTSKSFLSTLGYCKCYSCKDKNSVDVNEDVGEISFSNAATKLQNIKCQKLDDQLSTGSFRENHFTFPTGSIMSPIKVVHFQEEEEIERKSLEVFGSPVKGRLRNKSLSLEKRLAMLSWDHTTAAANDDEINSDCSSDLFEIESLTNKASPFLTRQPSDNNAQSGCVTPTTCYAPSEASVEWSVATASALDFDERRPSTATITSPARVITTTNAAKVNINKDVQKRRSSSLLGCKSQKSVKVAEDAHKKNDRSNSDLPIGRRKSESSMPVKRFEDETKVGGLSFRSQGPPTHRALATLSIPRPYSPRLSNISFNIQ